MYGTHRSPDPDHQGGKGHQERSSCVLVRPGRRLWVNATPAGAARTTRFAWSYRTTLTGLGSGSPWEITPPDDRGQPAESMVPACGDWMPGLAAQSLWRAILLLGITGTDREKTIGQVCREAANEK